jgi:hypothetical protein
VAVAAAMLLSVSLDEEDMQRAPVEDGLAEEPELALLERPDLHGVILLEAAPPDVVHVPAPLDDRAVAARPPREQQLPAGAGREVHQPHGQPAVHHPLLLPLLPLLRLGLGLGLGLELELLLLLRRHGRRVVEQVGGVELLDGKERAEAAQGAVGRDAEPILVRVEVGARHALLVDEAHLDVGPEPQRREDVGAQARRGLSVDGRRQRPLQPPARRDGLQGHGVYGLHARGLGRAVRDHGASVARRRPLGVALLRGGGGVVDHHREAPLAHLLCRNARRWRRVRFPPSAIAEDLDGRRRAGMIECLGDGERAAPLLFIQLGGGAN